jgi:hypothetical protein
MVGPGLWFQTSAGPLACGWDAKCPSIRLPQRPVDSRFTDDDVHGIGLGLSVLPPEGMTACLDRPSASQPRELDSHFQRFATPVPGFVA